MSGISATTVDTRAIYQEVLSEVGSMVNNNGFLQELFELFAYQGYNPADFFAMIYQKLVVKGGMTKADFIAGIKQILVFFITRGSRMDRGMDKSSAEGAKKIKQLMDLFGVSNGIKQEKSGPGGRTLPREAITVPRIAGCFPTIVCTLMENINARHVVSGPSGFPKGLSWAGAPAVIPSTNESLFNQWLVWAIAFDKVIKGEKNHDPENVKKYGTIIWRSNYIPETQRQTFIGSLKVAWP